MLAVIRFINKISELMGMVLMWLPWVLMVIIVWEVALRSLFGRPTVWAHELSVMTFGALAILTGAYSLRYRAHVNMDLFYMRFSKRGRALIDIITFPLFLIFCITILWLGWEFAFRSVKMAEISQSDWAPPIWPIKLALPVGAFLLLFQGVGNFLSDCYTLITGKGVEE